MSDMHIEIHNPSNLPLIDYRIVKPLQGDLKDLSDKNYNKLRNLLIQHGFKVPLFLWKHIEDNVLYYYLLDGHQRVRIMTKEDMQPYDVPYVLIAANDINDAKRQLLEISSQYGSIRQDELDIFTADLPEADLVNLTFDALPDFSRETGATHENEKHELMCPECGHVNVPGAFKPIESV